MTMLTDREVSRFRDLYDKEEWVEIAEYGEELLTRYCDYAEDEDDEDPFHYRTAQESSVLKIGLPHFHPISP